MKLFVIFSLTIATTSAAFVGCFSTVTAEHRQHWYSHGVRKAAFDLKCPVEALASTQVTQDARSFGVEGCGKRARYDLGDTGWHLDAASVQQDLAPSAPTPTAESAPSK